MYDSVVDDIHKLHYTKEKFEFTLLKSRTLKKWRKMKIYLILLHILKNSGLQVHSLIGKFSKHQQLLKKFFTHISNLNKFFEIRIPTTRQTTGNERTRISAAFSATASGHKLPILLVVPVVKELPDFTPPDDLIVVYI